MKLSDLQKLDQNIIKFLSEHRGIERAVKGKILAQSLDIDFRTLQSRIEYLHKQGCAIGSIDNGYFIPVNEDERRAKTTRWLYLGKTRLFNIQERFGMA